MVVNTGGPAFPVSGHEGMTIRDWLAGQVISTMPQMLGVKYSPVIAAEEAYKVADAMLAVRVR